jgi:PTS system mannose-specific IID component
VGLAPARIPHFGAALARLFVLQASWNYELMQGVGFGYAAEPVLRELPGGPEGKAYHEALARESRFFNAHPYLAALALGAALRAELDGEPPEKIERLRAALCGPLGALGDRLIWAGWLRACLALGLILVALGAGWWAVLAYLVLYNAVHFYVRVWGFRAGWREGLHVAAAMAAPGLKRGGEAVGAVAGFLVGAAVPALLAWQLQASGGAAVLAAAVGAAAVAALVKRLEPRMNGVGLAALVLAAVSAAGMVWP